MLKKIISDYIVGVVSTAFAGGFQVKVGGSVITNR